MAVSPKNGGLLSRKNGAKKEVPAHLGRDFGVFLQFLCFGQIFGGGFVRDHNLNTIPTRAASPTKQIGWSFLAGVYRMMTKIATASATAGQ